MTIDIPSGMYGEILRERKNGDGTHTLLLQLKTFGTPSATVKPRMLTQKSWEDLLLQIRKPLFRLPQISTLMDKQRL